ncbi:MAG: S-adenosylmethionine transporter [Bathelium mastoideum]|nr:MAG: S-adenosylmethionine transporter [Bathelium mastoideum]KAI9686261.1 MAG: S-adenosylmethionine transporter [Bathelium mastoideum]
MAQATIDSPYIRSLIAGGIAGTTVDLSLYPIDTLKTRLQSAQGFQPAGGFRGIYAGVGSALVGSAPSAALFFITYEATKRTLLWPPSPSTSAASSLSADINGSATGTSSRWSEPLAHMAAASLGEVAACAVRVPTEVVKQRAQASHFARSRDAWRAITAQRHVHGTPHVVRELYRGLGATVLREVPFTVIQFPLWEALKTWWAGRPERGGVGQVSGLESAVFGSVSGAVAAGVTTPLDVLKTRLMLSRERQGMVAMLGKILRENGPRAFWAGIGPRVLWISAGGAIFLGSYQWACNELGGGL